MDNKIHNKKLCDKARISIHFDEFFAKANPSVILQGVNTWCNNDQYKCIA